MKGSLITDLPIRPLCPQAVLIPGCVVLLPPGLGCLSDVAIAVRGRLQAGGVLVDVKSLSYFPLLVSFFSCFFKLLLHMFAQRVKEISDAFVLRRVCCLRKIWISNRSVMFVRQQKSQLKCFILVLIPDIQAINNRPIYKLTIIRYDVDVIAKKIICFTKNVKMSLFSCFLAK